MITTIIPCYNAEPYLAEALESVLAQTRPVDEVIVVDDCSTDGPAVVAQQYPVKLLQTLVNSGHAAARNLALDALQLVFDAASRLAVQCVAFDILRKNGRPLVREISYTFPRYKPWNQFPGYWHSDLSWIDKPKLIEEAQIEDFLSRLASVNEH